MCEYKKLQMLMLSVSIVSSLISRVTNYKRKTSAPTLARERAVELWVIISRYNHTSIVNRVHIARCPIVSLQFFSLVCCYRCASML